MRPLTRLSRRSRKRVRPLKSETTYSSRARVYKSRNLSVVPFNRLYPSPIPLAFFVICASTIIPMHLQRSLSNGTKPTVLNKGIREIKRARLYQETCQRR